MPPEAPGLAALMLELKAGPQVWNGKLGSGAGLKAQPLAIFIGALGWDMPIEPVGKLRQRWDTTLMLNGYLRQDCSFQASSSSSVK